MQLRSRIVGFDDGYFPPEYKGGRGRTIVLGVYTLDGYIITGLGYRWVLVDGRETTHAIIDILKSMNKPDLVLLDGVTYAGFDVVEPWTIHDETHTPIAVIQQYPLNIDRIRSALERHFRDAYERFNTIYRVYNGFKYLDTPWKTIQYYIYPEDLDVSDELRRLMIYSPIPEPLRIAHMIASLITRRIYESSTL